MRLEFSEKSKTDTIDVDRRALLCKLGKYGAYTAPVLLNTLNATKAVACSAVQCV